MHPMSSMHVTLWLLAVIVVGIGIVVVWRMPRHEPGLDDRATRKAVRRRHGSVVPRDEGVSEKAELVRQSRPGRG